MDQLDELLTRAEHPQALYPPDPSFTRAGEWLASSDPDVPDLIMVGAPSSAASLSRARCDLAPSAIRKAMWSLSTFGMGHDIASLKIRDMGDVKVSGEDLAVDLGRVQQVVAGCDRGTPLLVLGGDNSVTAPAMLGRIGPEGGLISIDAHHDVRDYKRDGISNGSFVRVLNDSGVEGTRIRQIGIRDFANSGVYSEYARTLGIGINTRDDVARHGISTLLQHALADLSSTAQIYVDIDIDVVDRAMAPGAPAALPGGLMPADLITAAYMAGAHPMVAACDIVEVDPSRDVAETTVRLAALCAVAFMAGVAERLAG